MKSMTAHEKSFTEFGLPDYYLTPEEMLIDNGEQIDTDYEQEQAENAYERMTREQRVVYNYVKQLIGTDSPSSNPKCIFIDGPGGSGKSFVLKAN